MFQAIFPNYQPPFPGHDGREGRPRKCRDEVALYAPTFHLDYIDDLRALTYVPTHTLDYNETTFAYDSAKLHRVRQRLIEEYGWPGEGEDGRGFRKQD